MFIYQTKKRELYYERVTLRRNLQLDSPPKKEP